MPGPLACQSLPPASPQPNARVAPPHGVCVREYERSTSIVLGPDSGRAAHAPTGDQIPCTGRPDLAPGATSPLPRLASHGIWPLRFPTNNPRLRPRNREANTRSRWHRAVASALSTLRPASPYARRHARVLLKRLSTWGGSDPARACRRCGTFNHRRPYHVRTGRPRVVPSAHP